MHAVVLLKRVPDPELPPSAFSVDPETLRAEVGRTPHVLSSFDANALEVALQLREALGSLRISALSLGPAAAEEVLRKALALTADDAWHVLGDDEDLDPGQAGAVLAAAIRRLGLPDLVLAGRQSADWEAGQVGGVVAEELGWPCLPFVSRLRPSSAGLEALQRLEGGEAVYELALPAVVTVTNDAGNGLRPARIRDVLAARARTLEVLELSALAGGALGRGPARGLLGLSVPAGRARAEFLGGASGREQALELARRLRQLGAV